MFPHWTFLVWRVARQLPPVDLMAMCSWWRWALNLEYIRCGLTWMKNDLLAQEDLIYSNTSLAFTPDIWRKLVMCSAAQQLYEHTWSWDLWCLSYHYARLDKCQVNMTYIIDLFTCSSLRWILSNNLLLELNLKTNFNRSCVVFSFILFNFNAFFHFVLKINEQKIFIMPGIC